MLRPVIFPSGGVRPVSVLFSEAAVTVRLQELAGAGAQV